MRGNLAELDLDDAELVELATKNESDGWGKLPPVLARLRQPVSQLSAATLEKSTRVCGSCYAMFADVAEMERHDERRKPAQQAHASSATNHGAAVETGSWFIGSRLADPATDFVMLGNHDAVRLRHEQRREKEKLRHMLHERMHGIDWKALPKTGHAAREMVTVVRDGQTGLQALSDPGFRQKRARRFGNTKAKDSDAEVDLTADLVDFEPSPVLALPQPPASPAHSPPRRSHARALFTPASPNTATLDSSANDDETERLIHGFVQQGGIDSVFDLPLSHTLMFELWEAMASTCAHAVPRVLPGREDVAATDPFFHVYSGDRHRFPLPPSCSVEMPWRGKEESAAECSPCVAELADRALVESTKVVEELTTAEKRELAAVLGRGAFQDGSTELTDRELRFIDGEELGDEANAEESDPFDDYDDEEGSEYDSFISDEPPEATA
eukprot:CAMPEP_0174851664 /NCGR_PEP_ID=MMETSP1114-20130205/23310_1 /TAXON_ID=312471 /ORGANISM="Neobodo designis, Strain CCAP 1951/1" /LENGTH=441 /DNA_ID=CAMNT_0016086211 /DNA_START=194 /DNA_END=1516 /DNA_ORIENTATION=-